MARSLLRGPGPALSGICTVGAVILALIGVWIAGFGSMSETLMRVGTFALAGAVALTARAAERFEPGARRWMLVLDAVLLAALAVAIWRYFQIGQALEIGLYFFTATDLWIGYLGLAVLLELTRRAFGWPLVIVCALALGYAIFGNSLPWIFRHSGYSLQQVLQVVWYSFDGVFGTPVSVVVTLILVFIVFGSILEAIGAGPVLLKFAFALTGRTRGGPAHAAIAASGVFGTMSGSVSGNVVGTGVMTIPMIVERGFPRRYAGGVEAAASSGGQFMPPIMGAVAFIMSDVTGIPYLEICAAALLPALFYYASLFVSVHLEAVRRDIRPIPRRDRPKLNRHDYVMSLCFLLPLALMMFLLLTGRSPALAGFWAVISAVGLGFVLNPDLRRHPWRVLQGLEHGGRAAAQIMVAVAAIGIVIGVMNMTGLGLRFAGVIQSIAGDSLFLSLVMMMLGSLVLGMGMPTVPAYLIVILVMGPAIEMMGVPTVIAHLFVVYFGVLSSITPPVAIAAFAAAPIARADPVAIGVDACRIALIGFVIPFVMVYNPSLALVADGFSYEGLAWICLRLMLCIWMFSTAFAGVGAGRLGVPMRVARLALGLIVLVPELWIEALAAAAALALAIADLRPRIAAEGDDGPAGTDTTPAPGPGLAVSPPASVQAAGNAPPRRA
ncbi:TRAP transporter fused permease subunit [Mesobaculum littorinae]|uniref:TRAP transporter fused permease subunit n=1 Tax=Mesobaculum littorinae TaxID=2486419 RepID=A0A438AH79_9RHOB|nr:TRAP transporter fused permease subunit [Mesobaculum littorinae]RVV98060.1 TRAP transporter fused permease subunit [Mesobaculum littorinae]